MLKQNTLQNFENTTMASLTEDLYEKSHESKEHIDRMIELCDKLGRAINLDESLLKQLSLLAKFHDVGKVGVNGAILTKKDKLTDDEWKEIKQHPIIGFRIAKSIPELEMIAGYILLHHERWDGKGYPKGRRGSEIPKLSRIITIVDAFDVMTSDRPYKKAMSITEAFAELDRCAGKQFDADLVSAFKRIAE